MDKNTEKLREKFIKENMVVICIMSNDGELCDPNCAMFEKCWGK